MTRTCTRCGRRGTSEDFYRQSSRPDGLRSECKECTKARSKKYRAQNLESVRERGRTWREANRDRMKELKGAWAKANPELVRAHHAAYRERHPHAGWESRYRHRVKMLGLTPVVEHFTLDDVVARYGDGCVYCGGEFQELDHYVPIRRGGTHVLDNVRPACTHCNATKGAQEDFDTAARHG